MLLYPVLIYPVWLYPVVLVYPVSLYPVLVFSLGGIGLGKSDLVESRGVCSDVLAGPTGDVRRASKVTSKSARMAMMRHCQLSIV